MKLHEKKKFYNIVSHGNQYIPEIEQEPIIICPECFGTEIIKSDISNHKDRYRCNDCSCEFTVEKVTVTTKLFNILSYVFGIGAIVLFIAFIVFGVMFASTKNQTYLDIAIVSVAASFIFALIFSCCFDKYDEY